jgi:hypothetical protein
LAKTFWENLCICFLQTKKSEIDNYILGYFSKKKVWATAKEKRPPRRSLFSKKKFARLSRPFKAYFGRKKQNWKKSTCNSGKVFGFLIKGFQRPPDRSLYTKASVSEPFKALVSSSRQNWRKFFFFRKRKPKGLESLGNRGSSL